MSKQGHYKPCPRSLTPNTLTLETLASGNEWLTEGYHGTERLKANRKKFTSHGLKYTVRKRGKRGIGSHTQDRVQAARQGQPSPCGWMMWFWVLKLRFEPSSPDRRCPTPTIHNCPTGALSRLWHFSSTWWTILGFICVIGYRIHGARMSVQNGWLNKVLTNTECFPTSCILSMPWILSAFCVFNLSWTLGL